MNRDEAQDYTLPSGYTVKAGLRVNELTLREKQNQLGMANHRKLDRIEAIHSGFSQQEIEWYYGPLIPIQVHPQLPAPVAEPELTIAHGTVEEVLDPLLTNAEIESRRMSESKARGFTGDACGQCGNFTLVRNGTCLKCNTCGGTTGCS